MVVMVSEPSQPAHGAGWTPLPERVKALDQHRNGLKPLFDVVASRVVELTAQLLTSQGSQIPAAVDEKLGICDLVFLGETMQERRHQKASRSD